jgi:hypothetical protein
MSSSTSTFIPSPNVVVRILAKPGKESRVEEVIRRAADEVRAHEPWITLYRSYRIKKDVPAGPREGEGYVFTGRGGESEYITVFQ